MTIETKLEELKEEQKQLVDAYNTAQETIANSRQRLVEIQGALDALTSVAEEG